MIYFLTSSPFLPDRPDLNPANGQIEELKRALPKVCRGVFVCSDPCVPEKTDRFAGDMRGAMERAGFSFSDFSVLDGRNEREAQSLVAQADFLVFAGGHVPTQNAFFEKIGLKKLLSSFGGVILGISAGTMNCAETVYAQPELPGEVLSPDYRRFLPGLGVTRAMILPHYQMVKNDVVDGLRVFEDVAYPDSVGRAFLALPDGSYLLGRDGGEEIRGEAYRIQDGVLTLICRDGEVLPLRD